MYVLKTSDGYVKGRSRWTTTSTQDLQQARPFTRTSDAKNSVAYQRGAELVKVALVRVS